LAGAVNMARDHAMAMAVGPGEGYLRWYGWSAPTLSLGRNEPAVGRWSADRLAAKGMDVVRRPTGGRAVLHHRELTYALAVPGEGPGSVRRLHALAGAALAEGLRRLGVPAERSPGGTAVAPDAGPCFRSPAEGEVIAGGRKLVGSAQVRLKGKLLQHGSILIQDDQPLLSRLVSGVLPAAAEGASSTHLGAWLDPVPPAEVLVETLTSAFRDTLGGDWHGASAAITLDPALVEPLERHYRSAAWTWRR
jgi:lipoate-protein ligase A